MLVYFLHMSASADPSRPCKPPARRRLRWLLAAALCLAGPVEGWSDDLGDASVELLRQLDAELRVTGMTFVGSRGESSDFVLRARHARFVPDSNVAVLEGVRVTSSDEDEGRNFEVSCARGELDVETNDFLAEGDVHGTTGDGRRYRAPWVRYDHEQALLYTDAPVVLEEPTGTFRGDGFRYHVKERRFRLLGNVSVVQVP